MSTKDDFIELLDSGWKVILESWLFMLFGIIFVLVLFTPIFILGALTVYLNK